METEWTKYNLNAKVRIKLHPKGMVHLLEKYRKLTGEYGTYIPRTDKDGYYDTQIWCLIQDFGEVMSMTSADYFDMDILIEKDTK